MTEPGFWEIGSSGQCYSRSHVIATVLSRQVGGPAGDTTVENDWFAKDFYCQELATGLYLFSYALQYQGLWTRRTPVWRSNPQGHWQAVFHQGTRCSL